MMNRLTRGFALLGALALCAACSKSDNNKDTAGTADSVANAMSEAAPAASKLTDANILAMLDELNAADSSGGSIAATKGTNADVKSFGKMMMKDHHKLRAEGQALATKINVVPVAPATDTIPAMATRMADSLTALPKGADWDKYYINSEVGVHQFVLSFLNDAESAATDSSLKAAITGAIPVIQGHLDTAKALQTKLSGATP